MAASILGKTFASSILAKPYEEAAPVTNNYTTIVTGGVKDAVSASAIVAHAGGVSSPPAEILAQGVISRARYGGLITISYSFAWKSSAGTYATGAVTIRTASTPEAVGATTIGTSVISTGGGLGAGWFRSNGTATLSSSGSGTEIIQACIAWPELGGVSQPMSIAGLTMALS